MDRGLKFNGEGYYDETAYKAIKNVDSEERYRAGNAGRSKFDMTPGRTSAEHHKKSGHTPEQIQYHNEKMAVRRAARKAAREAADIIPAYKEKDNG